MNISDLETMLDALSRMFDARKDLYWEGKFVLFEENAAAMESLTLVVGKRRVWLPTAFQF